MKLFFGNWLLRLILISTLLIPETGSAPALQASTSLSLVAPTACPAGGCAAGQRITAHAEFVLNKYEPGNESNVQVCFYTPKNWQATGLPENLSGLISTDNYTKDSTACENAPTNYDLMGGLTAAMSSNLWSSDAIEFSFRLGSQATNDGSLLMTVLERAAGTWTRTQQMSLTLPVEPLASVVYVANDSAACGGNTPCYVNSGGNEEGGIGTGLKDAIDSQTDPATINILGNYAIQPNAVMVNQPHKIVGLNNASIVASGADCTNPVLQITRGASVRNLTITGGSCSSTRRDLLQIQSDEPVTIEGNTLTGGNNAVHILPSDGLVTIRFNEITGNTSYAVLQDAGDTQGSFAATANNIYNNQLGIQVECSGKGIVEHNYFESSVAQAASNCTSTESKRLGAPIAAKTNQPGVDAAEVNVTNQKQYAFNSQIAFQRSSDGNDTKLYIVNHGKTEVPFTTADRPIACSNFWDVFLSNGATVSGTLNLSFQYSNDAACVAAIELSNEYCSSGDNEKTPLWWYDPATNATNGWDTTGKPTGSGANNAAGQTTTCNTGSNEIQVAIDSDGRPGLSDLNFVPFVVGVRGAAFSSFTATPNNKQISVKWKTTSEVNLKGYFLLRSSQKDSGYRPITDFITAKGGDMIAASYDYLDINLTNNVTYYYKLEVVSKDLSSYYTDPISATPNIPTPTPSFTPLPTFTRAPTYTRVPTRTLTSSTRTPLPTRTTRPGTAAPTSQRTSTPNRTTTARAAASLTAQASGTARTAPPNMQQTASSTPSGTKISGYPSESSLTPETTETEGGVVIITLTTTPSGGPSGGSSGKPPSAGAGLALGGMLAGILLGLGVLGGGGWYLWSRGMLPSFLSFLPPPKNTGGTDQGAGLSGPPAAPPA